MSQLTKKKSMSEMVYVAFFIVVTIHRFLTNTVIEYEWIQNVIMMITFILGSLIVIKVLSEWKNSWNCTSIILAIVSVGFIAVANFYITYNYVWEYILLILGARNIDYKKILKYYLIVVATLLVFTMGASLLGIVDNLVFYRNETSDARYAMGFKYVTDFCAHLFFLCAAYGFYRGKNIKYIEILGIVAVGVGCYVLSEGRNSTICIALLVIVIVFNKFINKEKMSIAIRKCIETILVLIMPLLAIVSILLGLTYNPNVEWMSTLNKYMGYRPQMDAEAFSRYKVTLFGQYFSQDVYVGRGGVGFPDNYFFIDCSYVSILLRMGIFALIGIILMWALISFSECKKGNIMGACILVVVSVHCFMEQHILNVSYNPFLLMLFAGVGIDQIDFATSVRSKVRQKLNMRVVKNIFSLVIFAVVVELLAFNMQSLLSVFKSYTQMAEYATEISGVTLLPDGTFMTDKVSYIVEDGIDKKVDNIYIKMNLYSLENNSLQYDTSYSFALYGYDEGVGEYQNITAKTIYTDDPASGYIELRENSIYSKYRIAFMFDNAYRMEINSLAINGPKPFNVSYIRIAIIYMMLVLVYYFGIEKRNAEVAPEAIEEAKANDQFVATGALRVDSHRNMQAVYDAKSPIYIALKRFFDIFCSGLAILLLSPIFIGTAIAIKLEDNGPVFFVQKRAGKNLKTFKMWKFRSMYVNADEKIKEMMANSNEQTGHAFKMKNDPRITKVGKFIRKFSIDELPQLFNIFLGDMSIVGPRPILVFQMEECDDYDKQRLIVQPGLTCIWQVSGRANIKWDKWIELDLEYIEKMSLWTDIKLILKTIPCVLSGDGAY